MTATTYSYEDNLESTRLRTRFLTIEDIETWTDFFKDKEAVELMPTLGLDTDQARAKLAFPYPFLQVHASDRPGLTLSL